MGNWRRVSLSISEDAVKQLMVAAGNSEDEQCGFVLDDGTILYVENRSDSPDGSFLMDVEDQTTIAYEYQDRIKAIWHTHPSGKPYLSKTDEEGIEHLYKAGCPWGYVVATTWSVREYTYIDRSKHVVSA